MVKEFADESQLQFVDGSLSVLSQLIFNMRKFGC